MNLKNAYVTDGQIQTAETTLGVLGVLETLYLHQSEPFD